LLTFKTFTETKLRPLIPDAALIRKLELAGSIAVQFNQPISSTHFGSLRYRANISVCKFGGRQCVTPPLPAPPARMNLHII